MGFLLDHCSLYSSHFHVTRQNPAMEMRKPGSTKQAEAQRAGDTAKQGAGLQSQGLVAGNKPSHLWSPLCLCLGSGVPWRSDHSGRGEGLAVGASTASSRTHLLSGSSLWSGAERLSVGSLPTHHQ